MVNWQYNPEDYGKVRPLTPGDYRVRIEKAEEQVSKTGKDMIKMTLKVSGSNYQLFYYMVFDPENRKRTNDKLGRIFDSFAITPGDLNLGNWKGKVGGANVINKPDNQGNMRSEVAFFLKREKLTSLPAWQENPVKQASVNPEMVDSDEPPF